MGYGYRSAKRRLRPLQGGACLAKNIRCGACGRLGAAHGVATHFIEEET